MVISRGSADPSSRITTNEWSRHFWITALIFFAISALTGVLYRAGLAYGFTAGLNLVNVRHAHSHTMYFGWATPALFLLIGLQSGVGKLRGLLVWLFAAAALAYWLFLLFGYRPVQIGPVRMPISVIAATINTVIWYVFTYRYYAARRQAEGRAAMSLWDTALAFLILATLGALTLPLLVPLGVENPVWSTALTHIFLDLFSEGWFVLAVLGLAYASLDEAASRAFRPALLLVTLGLPFTFAMGMPRSMVSLELEILARIGSFLVGSGLLVLCGLLWRRERLSDFWKLPLLCLGMKALAQMAAAVAFGFWFAEYHGLRILYLHVMLLGFVSTGLVAAAATTPLQPGAAPVRVFYGAVIALLLSLVPLTEPFFGGGWALRAAVWIALIPGAAAAFLAYAAGAGLNSPTPRRPPFASSGRDRSDNWRR